MYQEAHLILRFDTEQLLNTDDIRAVLRGQVTLDSLGLCEYMIPSLVENCNEAEWAKGHDLMKQQGKQLAFMAAAVNGHRR